MNDIYTVATVFETKGQEQAEKALRDNEAAVKSYEKAQQTLNNRMKISIDRSNAKTKTLGQLDAATKKAENEIKRLSVSVGQGAITSGQYQGRLNQISASLKKMGLENAQSKVLSYGRATREATTIVKQHEAALKTKAIAQGRATTSTTRLTQATRRGAGASQAIRAQFLGAANAIAVLDGPLGGVASRFSAFGVLAGRAGIALASLGIATTAFSFVAQRSIRDFALWETQIKTVENRLNSVGNQIALTSSEIVRLSESIGLSTLADERQVLSAASQLLTFRRVSTDVFEDVLKSAQDLAASGFGTIESETIKLAKALEDPRQSLTSLSRAGVVFSRQQRQVITAMVDSGREAEAMALILDNVEKQVGGAGLAQANNTLAGSFDTIGQAIRTASREFGEFLADAGGRVIFEQLAIAAKNYVESVQDPTPTERLKEARLELERIRSEMELVGDDNVSNVFQGLAQEMQMFAKQFDIGVNAELRAAQERVILLKEEVRLEELRKDLKESENIFARRGESIANIQTQIDLQKELVGLTEDQQRVQRALAAEGLAGDAWRSVTEQVEAYGETLRKLDVPVYAVNFAMEAQKADLRDLKTLANEFLSVLEDNRAARQFLQLEKSTKETNKSLRLQVQALEAARAVGNDLVSVTDIRRQVEFELQKQTLQTQINLNGAAAAAALLAGNLAEAAKAGAAAAQAALILKQLEENAELTARLADLSRTSSGGGGGGGVDPNAQYQQELEALQSYLEDARVARLSDFERIQLEFEERHEVLRSSLERNLLTRQEYASLEMELERAKEEEIFNMKKTYMERESEMRKSTLDGILGVMGMFATKSKTVAKALIAVNTALRVSEIIQDTARAVSMAFATYGPTPQGFAAAAKMQAMGKIQVATAVAAGAMRVASSGGGSSGGGASGRTANAPREVREATPQRVLIQGLDPNALFTGEQLQNFFDAFQDENDNRGQVFVVSQ